MRRDGRERDAARRLDDRAAVARTHAREASRATCCRAGRCRRRRRVPLDLLQRVALDLDRHTRRATLARARDGQGDVAADRREMVVLDEHARREVHAVIRAAAARTAYFSSARQPGVVLRVSRIFAPVPRHRVDERAVSVAMPDSCCMKFSATRSADEHAARVASHVQHGLARRHRVAVLGSMRIDACRVQLAKRLDGERDAGDHAGLARDERARATRRSLTRRSRASSRRRTPGLRRAPCARARPDRVGRQREAKSAPHRLPATSAA